MGVHRTANEQKISKHNIDELNREALDCIITPKIFGYSEVPVLECWHIQKFQYGPTAAVGFCVETHGRSEHGDKQ